MTVTGYSDRINHALAFAAKHHDRQVRKGTRLPYITHPANVAIILTRYGCDDDTENYSRVMLEQRIADKFSVPVLDAVLAVTLRNLDDDGVELSADERRDDQLERLQSANELARWVAAADKLHNVNTILADLKRTIDPNTVWGRFTLGKEGTIRWHRRVVDRLRELNFSAPIMEELERAVEALEEHLEAEATA